jgi:hypothetical protein
MIGDAESAVAMEGALLLAGTVVESALARHRFDIRRDEMKMGFRYRSLLVDLHRTVSLSAHRTAPRPFFGFSTIVRPMDAVNHIDEARHI